MKKSPLVEDALEILRRHDIAVAVEGNSPHTKLRFKNRSGKLCLLVVSRTPSDRRALYANRALLRRLLRSAP